MRIVQMTSPPTATAGTRTSTPAGVPGLARTANGGFSTIEALLAGVLLLIMALGVLPLFTQSLSNNRQGKLASDTANEARSELERVIQQDFDSPELTVPPGDDELERTAYFSETERRWIDEAAWSDGTHGFRLFTRVTTVRQYGFDALEDELLEAAEALDGGAPPGEVHFKEIMVEVEANALRVGPDKRVLLRTLKAV